MGFAFLLLSTTEGWSLPRCPGSPTSDVYATKTWTNCVGTKTYANGDKYVGEFKDNKRHGQGTYIDTSGNKYVGEWKDGKKHGQGTYTDANGNNFVGIYKDGKWTDKAP